MQSSSLEDLFPEVMSMELVDKRTAWKTCAGCGTREEVIVSDHLACSACGRVFAKMDALWQAGELTVSMR
jgi:hypothetical protein